MTAILCRQVPCVSKNELLSGDLSSISDQIRSYYRIWSPDLQPTRLHGNCEGYGLPLPNRQALGKDFFASLLH